MSPGLFPSSLPRADGAVENLKTIPSESCQSRSGQSCVCWGVGSPSGLFFGQLSDFWPGSFCLAVPELSSGEERGGCEESPEFGKVGFFFFLGCWLFGIADSN